MKWSAINMQAGVAVVTGLVALAAIAVFSVSDGRAQPPQVAEVVVQPVVPTPVVETKILMGLFNKQLYMHLKEEMTEQPTDEKAWIALEQRGLQTAEIANLVAIRPAEPPLEQWLQGAANLQLAGINFTEAAKTRNWEATVTAYRGILQRCNECHRARAPDRAPQIKL